MTYETGICSWSLQNNLERVMDVMERAQLSRLHLDVSALDAFQKTITEKGWSVTSTMIAFPQEDYATLDSIKKTGGIIPDESWPHNRELALDAIRRTAALNIPYLSTHAGFIDHNDAAGFRLFCDRIYELGDAAAESGIMLLLETGQESAEDLRHFLDIVEHPALGVNFDPANMILYGKGNPIEAIPVLAPWIKHVHIKDAVASPVPGEWGQEVPWGEGNVETAAFFETLEEVGFKGFAAIERETGDQRETDILKAAERLEAAG